MSTAGSSSSSTSETGSTSSGGGLFKFAGEEELQPSSDEGLVVPPKITIKRAIKVQKKRDLPLPDKEVEPLGKKAAIEDILLTIPPPEAGGSSASSHGFSSSSSSSSSTTQSSEQPVVTHVVNSATDTPPEGVCYWSWIRVTPRPIGGFANSYDPGHDPRLKIARRGAFTPHKDILHRYASSVGVLYAPLVIVAGKILCRLCAGRKMKRVRTAQVVSYAGALVVLGLGSVFPVLPESQRMRQDEVVEEVVPEIKKPRVEDRPQPPPSIPLELEKYRVNIKMEYWLGLRRVPTWMTKHHLTTWFSAPSRPVLKVRFFYDVKEVSGGGLRKLMYAVIKFNSPEHVAACLAQLWVVDGSVWVETVDCCGSMYGRFVKEINGNIQ